MKYAPIYRMDIANMGLPVYMEKHMHVGDTIHSREYMEMKFYLYVEKTGFVAELEGLGTGESDLMQIWFKEIGGKVYTFRIYHVCDYNYILDIICLEQDKVTPIGRYMIAPKRKFVVTEGEIFTTAG